MMPIHGNRKVTDYNMSVRHTLNNTAFPNLVTPFSEKYVKMKNGSKIVPLRKKVPLRDGLYWPERQIKLLVSQIMIPRQEC